MKPAILIGLLFGILLGIGFVFVVHPASQLPSPTLGGMPIEASPKLGLNVTKTVTSTAVKLLSANSGAQLRACTNTGAVDVTLSATTTGLTFGTGYVLRASSSITWSGDSLYTGDIWVIGTSTVGCLEI